MESCFKHKGLGDALRSAAIEVGALNFSDPCPQGRSDAVFPPCASILIIPSAIVSPDPSDRFFFFFHFYPSDPNKFASTRSTTYLTAYLIRQCVKQTHTHKKNGVPLRRVSHERSSGSLEYHRRTICWPECILSKYKWEQGRMLSSSCGYIPTARCLCSFLCCCPGCAHVNI